MDCRRDLLIVRGAAIACIIAGVVEVTLTTPAFRGPVQLDGTDAMPVVGMIVASAILVLCGLTMLRSWITSVIAFAITSCAASYWLVVFMFGSLVFVGIHVIGALTLATLLAAAVAVGARSHQVFPTVPAVVCITFGAGSVAFYSTMVAHALQSELLFTSFSDEMIVIVIAMAWVLVALCGLGIVFRSRVAAAVGLAVTVLAALSCIASVILWPMALFQFGPLALLLLYALAMSTGPID
jgi:hypothetical protein